VSFPDAPQGGGPTGTDVPFDPTAYDDDVRSVRARLGPADPARGPGGVGSSLDARRELAARLALATSRAGSGPAGSESGHPSVTAVRRGPSRWLAVPIAAVVALVVGVLVLKPLANDPPAGAAVVRAAAATTEAAGTARLAISIEGMGQTVTAEGVGDLGSGDGQVTVHAPSPVGDVEVVHLGDDLYVSTPAALGDVVGGAEWIHVDGATLQSLAEMAGEQGLGGVDPSAALDPVKAVELVRSVSGEVTEVGPDTVGGDPVTHYATHLDPAKVADQLATEADRDQLAAALGSVGPVPVDLWIDDAGRLRKVSVSIDLGALPLPALPPLGGSTGRGERPEGPLTASFELSAFGVSLDAARPPAGSVAEVGPLLASLRRAIGR
jgi:hypothetical protein